MTENKLLLTGEELAIAVNAGVDKAVEWSRSNPNTPDTTYLAMREKCIIESVSQSQLSKVLNAGYKSPEEVEEIKNKLTFELGEMARQATFKVIEEAKTQERERVITLFEKNISHVLLMIDGIKQALKFSNKEMKAND